jgi:FkbM family methyltransferase
MRFARSCTLYRLAQNTGCSRFPRKTLMCLSRFTMDAMENIPFRNLLPVPDRLRYLAWRLLGSRTRFQGRFRNGPCFSIRPKPSYDFDTVYEVFRLGIYDQVPTSESVRHIVDLGANVGYSCLRWCSRYPNAHIIAFEPHPVHCELLASSLRANGWSSRVTIIPAGAAATARSANLIDDDIRSKVVASERENHRQPIIPITLVDVFSEVDRMPIDILKIDIEGGEYEIMQDRRFDELAARCRHIVMEWHLRAPHHLGPEWCTERLTGLGFSVGPIGIGEATADTGLLAAKNRRESGR